MEYLVLLAGVAAGFHAFTYGRWLRQNGNKAGMLGVYFLIVLSLALPVYRMYIAR